MAINKTYSLQDSSAVVTWDDVILNKNNNLDNRTGIYYAPINGLYEFSLTVCVPANHIVSADILTSSLLKFSALGFGFLMQKYREYRPIMGRRLSNGC